MPTSYTYANGPNILPATWADFESADATYTFTANNVQFVNAWGVATTLSTPLSLSTDWAQTGSQSLKAVYPSSGNARPGIFAGYGTYLKLPVVSAGPTAPTKFTVLMYLKNGTSSSQTLEGEFNIWSVPTGVQPGLNGLGTLNVVGDIAGLGAGLVAGYGGTLAITPNTDYYLQSAYFGPFSGITGGGNMYVDDVQIYQDNYPTLVVTPPEYVTLTYTGLQAGEYGECAVTPHGTAIEAPAAGNYALSAAGFEVLSSDSFGAGALTYDLDVRVKTPVMPGQPDVYTVSHLTASGIAINVASGATQDLSTLAH